MTEKTKSRAEDPSTYDPDVAPTEAELERLQRRAHGDVMFGGYAREHLFVALTDLELLERGQQLASVEKTYDETEEEMKRVAKGFRDDLKAHRQTIQGLSTVIEERREKRMVKVVDRADYRTNEMQTIRIDTGEIVRKRELTRDEMQGELFGEA